MLAFVKAQTHTSISLVLLIFFVPTAAFLTVYTFNSTWPDFRSLASVVFFASFVAAGLLYATFVNYVIFSRCQKCGGKMRMRMRRGERVKYTCENCGAVE